ncbi:CHAT domain-containing protein [Lactifluus subvellereus]|nr:CHAT domain-containing protein [Lactifluus subvellereus]
MLSSGSSTDSITQLDDRIMKLHRWLSSHPYSHPERRYYLLNLANVRLDRLNLLHTNEDLDNAILHFTEVVLLPLHPSDKTGSNVVLCLSILAKALLARFQITRQPGDLESSIDYFHYLLNLDLPLGVRKDVTVGLVKALGSHVELEVGNTTHSTEMLVLCRELLTLDSPGGHLVDAIVILKNLAVAASGESWEEPLDQVIEYMREAIEMCPSGSHSASTALAQTLTIRFMQTHSTGDLHEAIVLADRVIASQPLGDGQNKDKLDALFLSAELSVLRFSVYENSQNLEGAISRIRDSLVYHPPGHNLHSILIQYLADLTKKRSSYFHLTMHPQSANSDTSQEMGASAPQLIGTSDGGPVGWDATFHIRGACSLTTIDQQIQHLEELLSGTVTVTSRHEEYLCALADWNYTRFDRTDDITDLEKSIEWRQMQLASTQRSLSLHAHLTDLGFDLFQAFKRNHRISFLEESILLLRHVIKLGDADARGVVHRLALGGLHRCLLWRWRLIRHREDLDEAILLLQMSINHECSNPPDKLQDACNWANLARRTVHSSVSTAYETAMSWMERSLVFAPTLHTKHAHLVAIQETNKMPLAYASYRVEIGHLEQAVETLEQGRALLWSEMRGLRTSIDQLSVANPALATKLAITNRDLETVTMSIPLEGNGGTDGSSAQGEGGMDMFGQLLKKQRTLLDERDILTSKIQALPGFENFLKTPSFDTLRAAAERGPVIIVNHCEWRSDIIITLHHSPPFLIATPKDFYDRANELADRLSDTRKKHRLESLQYQRTLCSVLKGLYELVGQPVISKLRELNIPEQSRVWWCPTSVFCSLPLHAMGPIPSQDKVKRYFSDVYISSYTSTLSALIKSREPGEQTSDLPSLLVIAPPDKSLPGVKEEIGVIKQVLGGSIRNLILEEATSENAAETLRHHRFAHFACHGVLEAGKPFDASFMLLGHNRLTLLDIVRSQLPAAEFALLSACHTAELTDGSIADEALHLTAAMQYCGFRSVVGTMWAMADTDGRDLAHYFYQSMFSSEDQRVPYYERSAKALRDAAQKLRRERRVGLERWVNFVHYGA